MDRKTHLTFTGKSNDLILSNTRMASSILQARNRTLVIRMVVVPGINDGQNIYDMADFLCSLPFMTAVELLPYHNYGVSKYDLLGRSYSLTRIEAPSAEMMEEYKEIVKSRGLVCQC
jgi:pyruvate formate lyase activating enzyme